MACTRFACLAVQRGLIAGLGVFLLTLVVVSSAHAAGAVGHVTQLSGGAVAEGPSQIHSLAEVRPETWKRALAEGAEIFAGDVITTDPHANLELLMVDGTKVTLGSDSELRIDSYVYAPGDAKGGGALAIVRGAFRVVTGGLAQLPGEPLHIKTATVALGIRGTDIRGNQHGDQLFIAMLDGKGVSVADAAGVREITNSNFTIWVSDPNRQPSAPYALSWFDRRRMPMWGHCLFVSASC